MCKHMSGIPEEQCHICQEFLEFARKKEEEKKDEKESSAR